MKWSHPAVPHANGTLKPAFGRTGDAFASGFTQDREHGASFCVIINDVPVVNIYGGFSNRQEGIPWTDRTVACIYSSGKAVLALLVARQATLGRLDYDTPVAAYWPQFARKGKESVTLAEAMSHQAGLCGFPEEMPARTWLDWKAVTDRIEAMEPLWPPGTASGYHPQTFGFITGEVLRRVSGKDVRRQIAELNRDIYCGMTPAEIKRAARMTKPPAPPDLGRLSDLKKTAFLVPWASTYGIPPAETMAAQVPGSNMHANAFSLASALHPFVNGGKRDGAVFLDPRVIGKALQERIRGDDLVLPFRLSWSAGLMRNSNGHLGPDRDAYGHPGFGGSCVVIDPENRLTAAYVMNAMSPHLAGDPRPLRLLDTVYAALR